jgi:hypothetical protein
MTSRYLLERLAGRDPNLRAGDADRERIADRLRTAHTQGRLDLDEFQQRLEHCYESRTFGELDQLVRDLPPEPEPPPRPSSARLVPRGLAALAVVLFALIAVSATAGHHHVSWLWIPVVFVVWRMLWWRRRRWVS